MKEIIYCLLGLMLLLSIGSCKKDNGSNSSLTLNTWRIDEKTQGHDASFTYSQLSGTFSTQGYQLLQMKGDDVAHPTNNHCLLNIYINTIGPPPTGDYTVVPYNKLATVPNAVYIQTVQNSSTTSDIYRDANEGQTLHIIMENGNINIKSNNLRISVANRPDDQSTLSVNLRK